MLTPKVLHDAVWRSTHAHGALGVSKEMPFSTRWSMAAVMSVVEGPTEVLKVYQPSDGLWKRNHLPARRDVALRK
jgi:acyl-CoA dehydrogenase